MENKETLGNIFRRTKANLPAIQAENIPNEKIRKESKNFLVATETLEGHMQEKLAELQKGLMPEPHRFEIDIPKSHFSHTSLNDALKYLLDECKRLDVGIAVSDAEEKLVFTVDPGEPFLDPHWIAPPEQNPAKRSSGDDGLHRYPHNNKYYKSNPFFGPP